MGMCIITCYIGSLLNNFFTPYMLERTDNIFTTSVVIMFVAAWSQIACYIYILLSFRYEHLLVNKPEHISDSIENLKTDLNSKFQENIDKETGEDTSFRISDLKYVHFDLWMIFIAALTTSCAYYSFTTFITDFFQYKYQLEYSQAKNYAATLPGINAIFILIISS